MAGEVMSELINHIKANQNFLLSGGAGSGKTHTLIEVLNHILNSNPHAKVACITFTNVAADEIKARAPYSNLWVSTIHDFLWDNIKGYQKNLKSSFIKLVTDNTLATNIRITSSVEITNEQLNEIAKIQYKEFRRLEDGIVSHNEVLKLANFMFATYPLLGRILQDRFKYIFIDEYQDTNKLVIEIFLDLLANSGAKSIIGLFGDSMQSIYSDGIGNVQSYVDQGRVKEVVKADNNRCSRRVIGLLNKIRQDIRQEPTNNNLLGDVKFLYSMSSSLKVSDIREHAILRDWDFEDSKKTKELYLTHRLIAGELGFPQLFNLYSSKNESLLKPDQQDPLIKHLFRIQMLTSFYERRQYNQFIKGTDYKISSLCDKRLLREKVETLKIAQQSSIGDAIRLADESKFVKFDDKFTTFVEDNQDLYGSLSEIRYQELTNVYMYVNEFTMFSTQHNIKGTEFENVLVILDNGGWNLYNFKYLFENTPDKQTVIERTKRIFYVCCSRSKDKLVVFFSNPSGESLKRAVDWFGEENVIEIR